MTTVPSHLCKMSGSYVDDDVQLLDETIQHNLMLGMRPKSVPPHYQGKFLWPKEGNIRVKFELGNEKRVTLFSRPLTVDVMLDQLQVWFPGHRFTIYSYSEVQKGLKPLATQADLDHVLSIHDSQPLPPPFLKIVLLYDAPSPVPPLSPPHLSPTASPPYSPRSQSPLSPLPLQYNAMDTPTRVTQRFSSDPYPEGFRASPDFRPDIFTTYHGQEIHPRSTSPPPWFVREGDVITSNFHAVTDQDRGEGVFIPEEDAVDAQALHDPPSPDASVCSIPSTPSEFTFNSRSPADSLSELARNGPHHPLEEEVDVDPLDHPGSLTRTFPRDREPRNTPTNVKSLYRTFPLNDHKMGGGRQGRGMSSQSQLMPPIPSRVPQIRPSDSELALQRLASLDVSNNVSAPKNWIKGKLLGSGAFGQVFICHDSDTGMEMAVKVIDINHIDLRPHNLEAKRMQTEVRSFETELQLLKNLRHEKVVTYYGTERTDGKLYIFMEYMPGGSVYQHLRDIGPLNEILARKYSRQILDGVAYLHDNRIVHRDIKGANILRDSFGNVKLADFGASKRLQTIRSGRSGLKSVQGTPYWMAPEVIKGEACSDRADIWSIGATVVEMLLAHPPWYEFEPTAAMFKIVMEETVPDLPAHCSEHVHHFLSMCFIKDRVQRPSARELLETPFVNT